MMRPIAIILAALPLSACISVHQTPLPDNSAIAVSYPKVANGERQAETALAMYFQRGYGGVGANAEESIRHWLKLAEQGNPQAMLGLAIHYRPSDREQAVYWYRRAAEAGNLGAPGMLADYHAAAQPAGQDFRAALLWAFIAGNNGQINRLRPKVEPAAQEEAARLADAWLKKYRNKDKP